MKIHRAGTGTILFASVAVAAIVIFDWFLMTDFLLQIALLIATAIVFILIIQFFRYPQRIINPIENAILSPADGKICVIKETTENEYLKTKCLQVSIFMSPTNVHINWIPVPGTITYMKHKDGEFYAAFKDKSAEENERTTTAIKMNDGREIVMSQVAGAMARRIINYVQVGDSVDQTTELGFIRFGSRVDLYLPPETKLMVKLNDKVKGSQTIIGKI